MASLHVENLFMKYGKHQDSAAIDNVSIEVEEGALLVLLGPSGCGKTTLLRCIAGLEEAQKGKISFGERTVFDADARFDLPTYKRDIGLVFQNYSLWPHMTVYQNVEYPLSARRIPRAQREKRSHEVLRIVQCDHLTARLPSMLSGGQQQRIALARALAPEPQMMLLDEPLSNLDAVLRLELRAQLRAIHKQLGFTGIYVTHDQSEAFALGSRVAVMNRGRIEQLGRPQDVYLRPATEYVAGFLGIRNMLPLKFDQQWTSPAGPLHGDLGVLDGKLGALNMYVRPERVRLSADLGQESTAGRISLPDARIVDALYGGGETEYVIASGDAVLYVKALDVHHLLNPGQPVKLSFSHKDILLYSEGRLLPKKESGPDPEMDRHRLEEPIGSA